MDQLNVQRWASSLRQSPRNLLQNFDYCPLAAAIPSPPSTIKHSKRASPRQYSVPTSPELQLTCDDLFPSSFRAPAITTDGNVGRHNSVRNLSASMRIRENKLTNDNRKYSFTLNFSSLKKDSDRDSKPRFYTFDMTAKAEEKIHSPLPAHFAESKTPSPLARSAQRDLDAVSDAGTYTIEDDVDQVQDVKPKPKRNPSSSILKRYVNESKTRHGTFDLHGMISAAMHTVTRPVVDMNIPTRDLPSSSSSHSSSMSSIHSLSDEPNLHSPSDPFTPTTLSKNQIKPAECFVISPAFEAKPFAATQSTQQRDEVPWRAKFPTRSISTKDSTFESNPSSTSVRPEQNVAEKPSLSAKTSTRLHTAPHDSTALQPVHANPAYHRLASASSATHSRGVDESVCKATTNKPSALRQQRSVIVSSVTKPAQTQAPSKVTPRSVLKQNTSVLTSNSQTNRAVELRRARAQAKIEELAQRTKKQLLKSENTAKNDIMSVSWHSSAVTLTKTNSASSRSNLRPTAKPSILPERENLSATRTISSAADHRPSSVSPSLSEQKLSTVQQKSTGGSQTDGLQLQRMTTSAYSTGTERCDTLRENGQRLAIRLIQLSSGILQKLKLGDSTTDDDTSVDDLERLVEKLQTVNQTLTTIDAALTGPINDDAFI